MPQDWITMIESTWAYSLALNYYGLYPLVTSIIWVITAMIFYYRRDRRPLAPCRPGSEPRVSVLIPAYCEEAVIADAVSAALRLDYPDFEVIVINDGSPDGTADRVRPFLADPRVRLIDKKQNAGKALALNDGIREASGELVVIMDADAMPDPQLLRVMTPHFECAKVGAVAGNARVRNKSNVLAKMQAIEFTSIISLMRRAQRIWGTMMCVSGVVGMFRKSALLEAGMFSPGMATEDIDVSWKMQMLGYDIRYEPRAITWMIVPESVPVWWKQRRRWALGLGQVLRRHRRVLHAWDYRNMLPLYLEACLSTLWSLVFVLMTAFWCVCWAMQHVPRGGSPIPNLWGMLLVTACLVQLACGMFIDSRYEPGIVKQAHLTPLYPLAYWMLSALATSIYTVKGLWQPLHVNTPTLWHIQHAYQEHV